MLPHLAVFTEKSLSEVVPRGQRGILFAFPATTLSHIFFTKLMKTKSIAVDKQVRTKDKRKADPQDRKQDSSSQLPLSRRLVFHNSTLPTPTMYLHPGYFIFAVSQARALQGAGPCFIYCNISSTQNRNTNLFCIQ